MGYGDCHPAYRHIVYGRPITCHVIRKVIGQPPCVDGRPDYTAHDHVQHIEHGQRLEEMQKLQQQRLREQQRGRK